MFFTSVLEFTNRKGDHSLGQSRRRLRREIPRSTPGHIHRNSNGQTRHRRTPHRTQYPGTDKLPHRSKGLMRRRRCRKRRSCRGPQRGRCKTRRNRLRRRRTSRCTVHPHTRRIHRDQARHSRRSCRTCRRDGSCFCRMRYKPPGRHSAGTCCDSDRRLCMGRAGWLGRTSSPAAG